MAAGRLIMVRPAAFGYNAETADSNIFQSHTPLSNSEVNKQAQKEFDGLADKLLSNNIEVRIFEDNAAQPKPDAVFLNNWFSTHPTGEIILYPMLSPLRRQERRQDIINYLQNNFIVKEVVDITSFENEGRYLEGTGSLVINHTKGIVFANLSARTDAGLAQVVADKLNYVLKLFTAHSEGREIYHTNVLMADGGNFLMAGVDMLDEGARDKMKHVFEETYKDIVYLNVEQINNFAGNALMVKNKNGEPFMAMSERAFNSLHASQVKVIEKHCGILFAAIPIIENVGGGSVRCMLAENYLQSIQQ